MDLCGTKYIIPLLTTKISKSMHCKNSCFEINSMSLNFRIKLGGQTDDPVLKESREKNEVSINPMAYSYSRQILTITMQPLFMHNSENTVMATVINKYPWICVAQNKRYLL